MDKLLIVCGPTATGKTKLAIRLAKKFSGEIASVDSRQVYQGMDIGTGKDIKNFKFRAAVRQLADFGNARQISNLKSISNKKFRMGYYLINRVKIWLLDVVNPDQEFNVADYYHLARGVIENIWRRGKLPILTGGTGFYIKAIMDGIESLGIEPDWELREKLASYPIIKLSNYLKRINPGRWKKMNESDRRNPRRLIRAIEIATKVKSSASAKATADKEKLKVKNCLLIGLTAPYKVLYQRIDERVEKRLKEGVVREIKGLLKKGYSWDLPAMSGMGYREFKEFFEKKITFEEAIQKWKFDEHGYARRQMTWFRKALRQAQGKTNQSAVWFDITRKGWENKVERAILKWYNCNINYTRPAKRGAV